MTVPHIMAVSTIPQSISRIGVVDKTVTIPANSNHVTVDMTSAVPDGWKFMCMLWTVSSGWAGFVFPSAPTSISGNIWATDTTSSARDVKCYALVYK